MRCYFCPSTEGIRRVKSLHGRRLPACPSCRAIQAQFLRTRDIQQAEAAFAAKAQGQDPGYDGDHSHTGGP